MSARLTEIRRRWQDERKVSAANVEWLLEMADAAETMKAAKSYGSSTRRNSLIDDLFGGIR